MKTTRSRANIQYTEGRRAWALIHAMAGGVRLFGISMARDTAGAVLIWVDPHAPNIAAFRTNDSGLESTSRRGWRKKAGNPMNYMKVATLTSSLLARRGPAVPSTFAPTAMPPAPTPPAAVARKAPHAADTGGAVARPKRDGTGRIKMSLRLKPDLHLKLKVVAAFRRESAQKLLVAAIERYLDQVAPNAAREEYAWMAELEDELPYWPIPTGRASYDMIG